MVEPMRNLYPLSIPCADIEWYTARSATMEEGRDGTVIDSLVKEHFSSRSRLAKNQLAQWLSDNESLRDSWDIHTVSKPLKDVASLMFVGLLGDEVNMECTPGFMTQENHQGTKCYKSVIW